MNPIFIKEILDNILAEMNTAIAFVVAGQPDMAYETLENVDHHVYSLYMQIGVIHKDLVEL